ncbi:MAG: hypothetical protein KH230_20820 [Enterocloster asparagiformis]|nr:hypothetical protein [Enterocloster asparagiformis]
MNIALLDGVISLENGMTLDEAETQMGPRGFCLTPAEGILIYHGEIRPEFAGRAIVHLYFDPADRTLLSAVIHIFPVNFDLVQRCLEERYGSPEEKEGSLAVWRFADGMMKHAVTDRFGDEEEIYLSFDGGEVR